MNGDNLPQILLDLGERLVARHGFSPSKEAILTTDPLLRFLLWVDGNGPVREELEEMGFYYKKQLKRILTKESII